MLGIKHNVNFLADYDPEWPAEFAVERERIAHAISDLVEGIEHYGSTAVPGLRAKPIIDILVGVTQLDDWQSCRAPLEALGYDYAANAGVPGHPIFGRGKDATGRTHLVHVVTFNGYEWRSNLAFRDALRRDEKLRLTYLAEKQRAVDAAPEGRARYNELKRAFIDKAKLGLI
jgi:GrpB-like predicted nucleotidyltransferase (UPF0157 family)